MEPYSHRFDSFIGRISFYAVNFACYDRNIPYTREEVNTNIGERVAGPNSGGIDKPGGVLYLFSIRIPSISIQGGAP